MTKQFYETPTTKTLVVRFQDCILGVSGGANWSANPGGVSGSDTYGENDGESF